MYSYDAVPDAVAQVDELPMPALAAYAELIAFLELTRWEGAPYRDDKPDGNMRTMPFGKRAEGMAVYVILEERRRVVVVSVTWLELELAEETHLPPLRSHDLATVRRPAWWLCQPQRRVSSSGGVGPELGLLSGCWRWLLSRLGTRRCRLQIGRAHV